MKTGEFQPYEMDTPLEPKPEGCKAVHMDRLFQSCDKSDVELFFCECGEIARINMYESEVRMIADIHFADTAAVDKAMELRDKLFKGSKMRLQYFRKKNQRPKMSNVTIDPSL